MAAATRPSAGTSAIFWFFISWLFLLLVTLSTPIAKKIWLFDIVAAVNVGPSILGISTDLADVKETVKFGIFGWCSSSVSAKVLNFQVNQPGQCSKRQLGFTVSPELEQLLTVIDKETLVNTVQHGLSVVLVLHPIVCALTFLALVLAIVARIKKNDRVWDLWTTIVGFVVAVLTTVLFAVDIAICVIAKHKLRNDTEGVATVNWGNAPWLVLVAAIFLWLAVLPTMIKLIRERRQRKAEANAGVVRY